LDLNYEARAHRFPEEWKSGAERTTFYPESRKIAKDFKLAIKTERASEREKKTKKKTSPQKKNHHHHTHTTTDSTISP